MICFLWWPPQPKNCARHRELGRLLAYRGQWAEAVEELTASSRYWDQTNDVQGLCLDEAYRAQRALLLARAAPPQPPSAGGGTEGGALAAARRALELAEERQRIGRPNARDFVRAYWLLGAALRPNGQLDQADRRLTEALTRCRGINMVDHEADILLDLARLRRDQGQTDEAKQLAREALVITERSGYVLQGADVHLFLAELALAGGDQATALAHARQARQLATCDGPPDYTYKVAYDEAGAMLARLKEEGEGMKAEG